MLFNSGDCLSCDYGHTADRVSFGLKMMDHLFVASYDWVASGPTLVSNDYPGRLGFDAFPWDDVDQWSIKAMLVDSEELIEDHVAQGKSVFNYGGWFIYRSQARGTAESGSLTERRCRYPRRRSGNRNNGTRATRRSTLRYRRIREILQWSCLQLALKVHSSAGASPTTLVA